MIQLSNRLNMVADYVKKGSVLADIGSDHAYLPIALVQRDIISFAIAGEVVKGPYQHAVDMVSENLLTDKISVRLGDGLDVIEENDHVTTISIAGMGGTLISNILESAKNNGKLSGKEALILQPNVDEYSVRKWLNDNEYVIVDENILEENDKIYEIIYALPSDNLVLPFTEEELYFGRFVQEKDDAVFRKKWQSELSKNEYILSQLNPNNQQHFENYKKFSDHSRRIKERLS